MLSSVDKNKTKGVKKAKAVEPLSKKAKGDMKKGKGSVKGSKVGDLNCTLPASSLEHGLSTLKNHLSKGLSVKKCEEVIEPLVILEEYMKSTGVTRDDAIGHFYQLGWRGDCCV
jgi:hypothetical protein